MNVRGVPGKSYAVYTTLTTSININDWSDKIFKAECDWLDILFDLSILYIATRLVEILE